MEWLMLMNVNRALAKQFAVDEIRICLRLAALFQAKGDGAGGFGVFETGGPASRLCWPGSGVAGGAAPGGQAEFAGAASRG